MRGLYTIGVLDCLMDNDWEADYVIGVSAGACNGISYVSKQRGRSYRVNTKYLKDKRYVGLHNLIKTKSMFGMDFLFSDIPDRLEPFDYETYKKSPCAFYVGVTDVVAGEPVYFGREWMYEDARVLRASSSIPCFSPIVEFNGGKYLDGGTSDPIPVHRALSDGCDRVVVVLTRDRGYIKKPERFRQIYSHIYRDYPKMIEVLDRRHEVYNEELDFVRRLERDGKAIVIAPDRPVDISRFEKDENKLKALYKAGMLDAQKRLSQL